jgi:hypothetical protein
VGEVLPINCDASGALEGREHGQVVLEIQTFLG